MSENIKSFLDGFNAESKKQSSFNDGHRQQLECLEQIINEINAVEGFSAEIEVLLREAPALTISAPSGVEQSFFIQFAKKDPASNTKDQDTILFTTGLQRVPLAGNENGYDLTQTADRDECLKQISKTLVEKVNRKQLYADTLSYCKKAQPKQS